MTVIGDELGALSLRGYVTEMLRWREACLFGTRTSWARHIAMTAPLVDVPVLAIVGREVGAIIERYQHAAVRSSVRYLNSYGLRLGSSDVIELAQGSVGAHMTRAVPEVAARGEMAGLATTDALRAAEVYISRIASTDLYRVAGDTVATASGRSPRFTGRWRRRPGPGACQACHESADTEWTRDRDAVVQRVHPGCSCVVEPESAE